MPPSLSRNPKQLTRRSIVTLRCYTWKSANNWAEKEQSKSPHAVSMVEAQLEPSFPPKVCRELWAFSSERKQRFPLSDHPKQMSKQLSILWRKNYGWGKISDWCNIQRGLFIFLFEQLQYQKTGRTCLTLCAFILSSVVLGVSLWKYNWGILCGNKGGIFLWSDTTI